MKKLDFILLIVMSIMTGGMTVCLALMPGKLRVLSTILMLFAFAMSLCGAYEEYLELKNKKNEER